MRDRAGKAARFAMGSRKLGVQLALVVFTTNLLLLGVFFGILYEYMGGVLQEKYEEDSQRCCPDDHSGDYSAAYFPGVSFRPEIFYERNHDGGHQGLRLSEYLGRLGEGRGGRILCGCQKGAAWKIDIIVDVEEEKV